MSAHSHDQATVAAAIDGTGPRCTAPGKYVGRTWMVCYRPPHGDGSHDAADRHRRRTTGRPVSSDRHVYAPGPRPEVEQ